MTAIEAQLQCKDVLIHAATGFGKTAIAAGLHVHETCQGRITLMVSPLIMLQEDQVASFQNEYKLTATAVNSNHGGCTTEIMKEIIAGKYQIVLISPELALSTRFIDTVLRNSDFTRRLFSVVIDEAHVVSHWGAQFHKMYGRLGTIRAFIPKLVSMVAMSATLSKRIRDDVLSKLQFKQTTTGYVTINVGNDRSNVSLVVRAMQYAMNSYVDLDFVIPKNIKEAGDIPLTWIYADSIPSSGIIRPYSATYSTKYCDEVMKLVRSGQGCNIPNIERVVQWRLTASMSTFVKRAGCAARGPGRSGIAILLVERTVYEEDLFHRPKVTVKTKPEDKQKKRTKEKTAKEHKQYATLRGAKRGSRTGKNDAVLSADEPPLDVEVEDEGLKVFVQTRKCRRKVWAKIYGNAISDLLNQVCPGVSPKPPKETKLKKGVPCLPTQARLREWQALIKKRDFADSLFGASGFLKDETITLLSAIGPMEAQEDLERILADEWSWYDKYGQELFTFFTTLNVPPLVPIPRKPRAKKSSLLEKSMSTSKHVWGEEPEAERPGKQAQMESETTSLTKPPDATCNYYHYAMLAPYPSPMTPSHPFIPAPFESPLVPETPSNRPSYYRLPQTPQSQNPYYRTGTYNTQQSPTPRPDHTRPDQYRTMNLAWMGYYMYPHQSLPSALAPPGLMIQPSNHPPNHLYQHPLSFQGHPAPP
ncbi:hypothetical protein EDD85DRAFT_797446 [Armillaria nabsnona]|nr:hypothetical protein EDD85DRAFT_797446 [Armillaria nabsnona]